MILKWIDRIVGQCTLHVLSFLLGPNKRFSFNLLGFSFNLLVLLLFCTHISELETN